MALVPAERSRLGARRMPVRDDVLVLGWRRRRGKIDLLFWMLLAPPRRCGLGATRTPPWILSSCLIGHLEAPSFGLSKTLVV
jgi:hypothetical protein